MTKAFKFAFLGFVILAPIGCSKGPPQFQEAQIEMTLQDFESRYPSAVRLAEAKGTDGIPFAIYRRSSEGEVKKADYYFSENKLVGIIILFSKGTEFDAVVDDLATSNGEPKQQFMMANSKAAVWEHGVYFINMLQGTTETEIKLPTGVTQLLEPGDIVVMLGRKSK